jgi:hypothetical protein
VREPATISSSGRQAERSGVGRALARLPDAWVFPSTWLSLAVYLLLRFDRRFIPHDEGVLGQSAERLLRGELPHGDFDDPYSGGLAMIDALACRLFGLNMRAERYVVLLFALLFAAAVYRIARRAVSPWAAGFMTWLAVAWSVPNYFAGMPSWFNLFFATFGILALLCFAERGRPRHLVLGGLCGGLSIAIKSIGAYYVLAALFWLVYREQNQAEEAPEPRVEPVTGWLIVGGLAASVAGAGLFAARGISGAMDWIVFVLPIASLAVALGANGARLAKQGRGPTFGRLARSAGTFAAGVLVPVAGLALFYAARGRLGDLAYGIFVAPRVRLAQAAFPLPPSLSLFACAPLLVALAAPLLSPAPRRSRDLLVAPFVAIVAAVLLWRGGSPLAYQLTWFSVRPLVPILCLVVALTLANARFRALPRTEREALFLLCAMCGVMNLVQFPFAFGVYFLFVAPLVALAALFLVASQPGGPTRLHFVCGAYFLVFALVWLNTSDVRRIGVRYLADPSVTPLALPRGGLRVSPELARIYADLVTEVQSHSPAGSYIYAAPDCPEVYFLTERKNPTRVMFEVLARDAAAPAAERRARTLEALERHHVDVVVLAQEVQFRTRVEPELEAALRARYPHQTVIAPLFVVLSR